VASSLHDYTVVVADRSSFCSTADLVHRHHAQSMSRYLQTATQQDPRTAIAAGELFRVWWYSAVRMWSQLASQHRVKRSCCKQYLRGVLVWYYICLIISRLTIICWEYCRCDPVMRAYRLWVRDAGPYDVRRYR
jgi:hypothetical protein